MHYFLYNCIDIVKNLSIVFIALCSYSNRLRLFSQCKGIHNEKFLLEEDNVLEGNTLKYI